MLTFDVWEADLKGSWYGEVRKARSRAVGSFVNSRNASNTPRHHMSMITSNPSIARSHFYICDIFYSVIPLDFKDIAIFLFGFDDFFFKFQNWIHEVIFITKLGL